MKKKILSFKWILIWAAVLFWVWFIPWVLVFKLGALIYFPYEPNGHDRFIRITGPIVGIFSKSWIRGKNIPPFCKQALVAAEDTNFYDHYGIDLDGIIKSYKINKRSNKMRRGGSTITQQLVKNAFLSRNKSYLRKVREIVGALLLNLTMSKDSQLTWYFNIIEFGPNIYGMENASKAYFKKEAKYLTPSQCLALVTVIPAPKKWNRSLANKNLTPFFVHRYNKILTNIKEMSLAKNKEVYLAQQMHLWESGKNVTKQAPVHLPIEDEEEFDEQADNE